ncbi:MAG: hypothetical protein IT449_01180 [Phycisphaerales bacterium]|nr:hypothetical protein [Phycisphaerales bacterium]
MMYKNKRLIAGAGAALAGGSLWAATFTWTGGGSDNDWDTTANWFSLACMNCYPDGDNDDATIPASPGGYIVDLTDETIDDLAIEGDTDFFSDGGTTVLWVDSLTIVGPARVEVHDSGNDDARIRTVGSGP